MSAKSIEEMFPELRLNQRTSVCIPGWRRFEATERLELVLDNPLFQRLRGVRQLALAHFVYPGALHSRFEHSLGVYVNVCQYLRSLWEEGRFSFLRANAGEPEIAALLLGALLHDIGHYPMAHAFEERIAKGAPEVSLRHDKIACSILEGRISDTEMLAYRADLEKTVKEHWNITLEDISAVIGGSPAVATTINSELVRMLHSFVDGPLDADKLDYLQRDSHHTGNPSGVGIDAERLVQSLIIESVGKGMAIKERGLAAAQSLAHARYAMFLTVYWHRMNRALIRMSAEAMRIWHESQPDDFTKAFQGEVFRLSDEDMLERIGATLDPIQRNDLIAPLALTTGNRKHVYRRFLTVSAVADALTPTLPLGPETHKKLCTLYDYSMTRYMDQSEREKWPRLQNELFQIVQAAAGRPLLRHQILFDVPDARFHEPARSEEPAKGPEPRNAFLVYGKRDEAPVSVIHRSPLLGDFLENWKRNARKVRIFVHPDLLPHLLHKKKSVGLEIARAVEHA